MTSSKTQTYISEVLLGSSFTATLLKDDYRNSAWEIFKGYTVRSEDNDQIISIYKNDRNPFERLITRIRMNGTNPISREVRDERAENDLLEFIRLLHSSDELHIKGEQSWLKF